MQYTQDYDEKYPPSIWVGNPVSDSTPQSDTSMPGYKFLSEANGSGSYLSRYVSWMDLIYPYVKSVQIFVCPDARNASYAGYGYSGCINAMYSSSFNSAAYPSNPNNVPMSLAQVQRPSEVFMLMDWNYAYNNMAIPSLMATWSPVSSSNHAALAPHLDGANFAFADGHVKWLSYTNSAVTNGAFTNRAWNAYIP
jgi:prepilin-type processing-associated H-X9-DG protein